MQVVWNYKNAHNIFWLEEKFAENFTFPWGTVANMYSLNDIAINNGPEKHFYIFEKGKKRYVLAAFVKWTNSP